MSKTFELDHLINELSVADQVLQTVDKAQKPDPVVEKVVVEKIVNIENRSQHQWQLLNRFLMICWYFSVFFSFFGF